MRLQLAQTLQQAWTQRGWLAILLWPLSQVYGLLSALNRQLYRWGVFKTHHVAVPVIVVGNIVAGGGGKTPTVMALVQHLKAHGLQVGVVSRGYGRTDTACREVLANSPVSDIGDEPALIFHTCDVPVFVARKRFDAASALLAAYPKTDVIISDDGLQHYALHHDIAVTVFDDSGLGNGWLLPAGPLRQRSTAETDLILHTGQHPALLDDVFIQFTAHRALADHAMRADGSAVLLADLAHHPENPPEKPLLALAGIAKPEAFFSMLRDAGVDLAETLELPDHADYSTFNSALGNKYAGYSLICTQKDAIKLWQSRPDALAVPLVFTPERAFFAAFEAAVSAALSNALDKKST
jgi:tetraacyldisaccharide 4'-kinase